MEQGRFIQILTIAGSDSSGGTDIQADLKTFQIRGVFGTDAVTAVTVQNTFGVATVHLVPIEIIRSQIGAMRDDFQINAFKLGILGTAGIIECAVECLKECSFGPVVLDPVMITKGGAPLLHDSAVAAMKRRLLLLADALTPSLPETQVLIGINIKNAQDAERAAWILQDAGVKAVAIKGGHSDDSHSVQCADWVFLPDGKKPELSDRRYPTPHTYGTGRTFPTYVTAGLAKGFSVENAVKTTKTYITTATANPLSTGSGYRLANRWAYRD